MNLKSESVLDNIMRTLLYYDIFHHPLTREEVFYLLPFNSITKEEAVGLINKLSGTETSPFAEKEGYVFVKPNDENIELRKEKERYSKIMWKATRLVTHIIKRCPFVRAVLVTGSLSKNSSAKGSDLDFMVITKKNKLWITRTLLMLFKKIFLFNSFKFFCINYLITEDNLEIEEKNIFTATEIVHIKATFNYGLMNNFIKANYWIK